MADRDPKLWPKRLLWMIALVLAFDFAFSWQRLSGAYASEFGGHPDEAAHVVTGLFVRDALVFGKDWLVFGPRPSPLTAGKDFADDYYAHYPKIGLGVWPPLFYLVQAVWTLPVPPTRVTLLLLMAALAGGLAVLLARVVREEYHRTAAACAAGLLLSLPLVRAYYGMVMAETLSATLMLGAMLAWGDYLDRAERRAAVWFGVLTALAILTKGTGLALLLAAPLALLLRRRFELLRKPELWGAVAIIVIFAGPWTWATRHLGQGGWLQPTPSWSFVAQALPYYAGKLVVALGFVLLPLLLIGFWVKSRSAGSRAGRWAAAGALIVSVVIFQSIAPVGLEARHLIPALPAALMFVMAGGHWVAERFKVQNTAWWPAAFAVPALAVMAWPIPSKGYEGFATLAAELLAEAAPAEVTLVASDAVGEGMFISEVALHERRPGHMIRRASKDLASSTWSGSGYQPAFQTDGEVLEFLTNGPIRYAFLALDESVPEDKRRAHHDQLQRLVTREADRFRLIALSEVKRAGVFQSQPLRLFKIQRKN